MSHSARSDANLLKRVRNAVQEFGRRKVGRCAMIYALFMWLNIQIGDICFPLLGLPEWSLTLLIAMGVLGFPVVLVLAWVFQLTPDGLIRDSGEAGPAIKQKPANSHGRTEQTINIGLLIGSTIVLTITAFAVANQNPLTPTLVTPMDKLQISLVAVEPDSEGEAFVRALETDVAHELITGSSLSILPAAASGSPAIGRQHADIALTGTVQRLPHAAYLVIQLIDVRNGRYLSSSAFQIEHPEAHLLRRLIAAKVAATVIEQTGSAPAFDLNAVWSPDCANSLTCEPLESTEVDSGNADKHATP